MESWILPSVGVGGGGGVSVGGGGRVSVGLCVGLSVGLGRGGTGWKGTYSCRPARILSEVRQLATMSCFTLTPSSLPRLDKVSPGWTI